MRGYIEQLVGEGLLLRDGEPYPVLRLTAAGCACCSRSGTRCVLYREVLPIDAEEKRARTRRGGMAAATADRDLFDVLREVRLRLARERGVPPMRDLSRHDAAGSGPSGVRQTIDDLHDMYGVGVRKAADFGEAFSEALRTFSNAQATTDALATTTSD